MKDFFSTLGTHFVRSFWGKRLWFHIVAIVLTYIVLTSGFDWWWYVHTSAAPYERYFFPAVVLGGLLPIIIPLMYLYFGASRRSKRLTMTGWGLGQAAFLGLIISSLYKAFTGRMPPAREIITDISHGFNFGFFQHGVFWGWPSSHTAVAFSMAAAFCVMYRKSKVLCALALIYALYIGVGVSMSIHWFSEFVAGAFIGTAIGLSVGTYFRQYTNK